MIELTVFTNIGSNYQQIIIDNSKMAGPRCHHLSPEIKSPDIGDTLSNSSNPKNNCSESAKIFLIYYKN